MIGFIINPGTGPVAGTVRDAWKNIRAFVRDLGVDNVATSMIKGAQEGRYAFTLKRGRKHVRIDMPGVPLEAARVQADQRYNPFSTPRLYINGSSFYWHYAVDLAREALVPR